MKKYLVLKNITFMHDNVEFGIVFHDQLIRYYTEHAIRVLIKEKFIEEIKETLSDHIDALFVKHNRQYKSSQEWRENIKTDLVSLFKDLAVRTVRKEQFTTTCFDFADNLIKSFKGEK